MPNNGVPSPDDSAGRLGENGELTKAVHQPRSIPLDNRARVRRRALARGALSAPPQLFGLKATVWLLERYGVVLVPWYVPNM